MVISVMTSSHVIYNPIYNSTYLCNIRSMMISPVEKDRYVRKNALIYSVSTIPSYHVSLSTNLNTVPPWIK